MTKAFNIGLIGLGFIGKVHATAYRTIPLCFSQPAATANLVAILRSKATGDEELVRSLGSPLITTDVEEFFSQPLDVVDICTPNRLHLPEAEAAAARKMHIYCEKPLANTLAEARQMAALARQAGIFTHTALVMRYLPAVRQMKALIQAGEIGEVINFRAHMFHSSYLDVNRPMSWRLRKAESGGGVFMDLGAHLVDMARYLLGEAAWVKAEMRTYITERPVKKGEAQREMVDVDDWAHCLMGMQNGATGIIETSRVAAGAGEETTFEVFGRRGALAFHITQPDAVRYYSLKKGQWLQGSVEIPPVAGERPLEQIYPGAKLSQGTMTNIHMAAVYDFLQCILEGKPSTIGFDEAVAAQEIVEAAYRSAERSGERLDLPLA